MYSDELPEEMPDIDMDADYVTFKESVAARYGAFYAQQAELFFDRAVHEHRKGLLLGAIRHAEFALELARLQHEFRPLYLVLFLVDLHVKLRDAGKARSYLVLAWNKLDPDSPNYDEELQSVQEAQQKIEDLSSKT